jgi:GH15 family glucan-1,4-alpha-glucosidase
MLKKIVFSLACIVTAASCASFGEPTALDLQYRGFFKDREYFFLRSGNLQYVIQADRADLGPAIIGYIFDASDVKRSKKNTAYNYSNTSGVRHSALEVVMRNDFAFTAFGQQTRVNWITGNDGIPTVQAVWWADGIRIEESFSGVGNKGVIRRTIVLYGSNIYGSEKIRLRLHLPAGNASMQGKAIYVTYQDCPQAIAVVSDQPCNFNTQDGSVEIPLTITPQQKITVETLLIARVPPKNNENFTERLSQLTDANNLNQSVAESKDYWSKISTIQSDDELITKLFNNTRYALNAIPADSGIVKVGPFQYKGEWVRDLSNITLGMTSAGHFELSRAILEHMIRDMITDSGVAMIGGSYTDPNREQFDQTGEYLYALRYYTDFTGDTSLVTTYREKLLSFIERPLRPEFRDATNMVHNKREFWEQTLTDGYELAYNMYVYVGLREAVKLAPLLDAENQVERWNKTADEILNSMLSHPTLSLVDNGHFIKRRSVTGEITSHLTNPKGHKDVPTVVMEHHCICPDASQALPIALRIVDPKSELARKTLDEVEKLRDTRWFDGGYDRYDSSSSINTPGPWPFATCFVLRAQHEAGIFDRSRRNLQWLADIEGGNSGSYYEEIPLIQGSQQNWLGIVQWTTAEIPFFVVKHYLGIDFENGDVIIRPALYPNSPPVKADIRFRTERMKLEISGAGQIKTAAVNGKTVKVRPDGSIKLPKDFKSGEIIITTK